MCWSTSDFRVLNEISRSLENIVKELQILNTNLKSKENVNKLPKLEDLNF